MLLVFIYGRLQALQAITGTAAEQPFPGLVAKSKNPLKVPWIAYVTYSRVSISGFKLLIFQ